MLQTLSQLARKNPLTRSTPNAIALKFYSTSFSVPSILPLATKLTHEDFKMVLIEEQPITSVEDVIKIGTLLKKGLGGIWDNNERYHPLVPPIQYPFGLWFRGHGNYNWGLIPSIFRKDGGYQDETSIVRLFKSYNPAHATRHQTTFEWLSLMQHYSSPTRLLDWSESLLVALYFAISDPREDAHDGALWILNAARLNAMSTLYSGEGLGTLPPGYFNVVIRSEMSMANDINALIRRRPLRNCDEPDAPSYNEMRQLSENLNKEGTLRNKLSMPVAVHPSQLSERLIAQRGVFTLYGGKSYYDEEKDYLKERLPSSTDLFSLSKQMQSKSHSAPAPFLKAVKIIASQKKYIREQLFELGIHQGSIFPELDYQSKFLKEQWTTPLQK